MPQVVVVVELKEDAVHVHVPGLGRRSISIGTAVHVVVACKAGADHCRYGKEQCYDTVPIKESTPPVVEELAGDEDDEVDQQVGHQDDEEVLRDRFLGQIFYPVLLEFERVEGGQAQVDD